LSAKPKKGFHFACADLKPTRAFIVYGGDERYPATVGAETIG
jgi:hypothetical protein